MIFSLLHTDATGFQIDCHQFVKRLLFLVVQDAALIRQENRTYKKFLPPFRTCVILGSECVRISIRDLGYPMARVITFHIPANFRPKVKWVPPVERGKVIEFHPAPEKKTA
jgi:hypothetical protein